MVNIRMEDIMSSPSSVNSPAMDELFTFITFHKVKADKAKAFTHFVKEVLCPAALKMREGSNCQAKMLQPQLPNDDGSFTYVVLIDPAFKEDHLTLEGILRSVYGDGEGRQYVQEWMDTLLSPQIDSFYMEKA
jgi:hypothetical protein